MGNFTHATTWHTPSATTANSANASFPAANVNDYTHPGRIYKATGVSTAEWLKFNLGGAVNVGAVVVDHTNVTSVKLFGHASNLGNTVGDWAGATYSTTAAVSQDPIDGRYKVYIAPSQTLQWWLLACNSGTAQDGAGVWSVGGVSFLSTVTEWAVNAEFPYEVLMRQGLAGDEDMAGGGYEPTALGPRYAVITLSQSKWPTSSGGIDVWAQITTLAGLSSASPVMFYRNYGSTAEVYICRRRGEATVSLTGPGVLAARSLVFRELV